MNNDNGDGRIWGGHDVPTTNKAMIDLYFQDKKRVESEIEIQNTQSKVTHKWNNIVTESSFACQRRQKILPSSDMRDLIL